MVTASVMKELKKRCPCNVVSQPLDTTKIIFRTSKDVVKALQMV